MSETITFEAVRDDEQFKRVKAFAETFNHETLSGDQIIMIGREGRLFGYIQIHTRPILLGSWHPDAGARNIKEAIEDIRKWVDMKFEGRAFTAVTLDHQTFPPKTMEKLGFKRLNVELYDFKG